MGLNIIERIQAKIEIFRLEQRYTRRRHRRSAFVSNATYVDGEYVYNSPSTTGSSSAASSGMYGRGTGAAPVGPAAEASRSRKRLSRFASVPVFGGIVGKRQSGSEWGTAARRNSYGDSR